MLVDLDGDDSIDAFLPSAATINAMDVPKNPFPGMDPWFEQNWSAFHTLLIGELCGLLASELPGDLRVLPEEALNVVSPPDEAARYRADVGIAEPWKQGMTVGWSPQADAVPNDARVVVAEPIMIEEEETIERWLEIRARDGRLVTVIEILSPRNKAGGLLAYREKQRDVLAAEVNLVEIDLLRGGQPVIAASHALLSRHPRFQPCTICVTRGGAANRHAVYPCPLRERLPAFHLPLRPTDADLVVDLQPLVDRCYATARFWQHDHRRPLEPALSDYEAAWATGLLEAAGL